MKKGIRRPVYFSQEWRLDRCFATAAASGYEGMEFIFRSGRGPIRSNARSAVVGLAEGYQSWQSLRASITYDTTEAQCAELASVAAGHGISIIGLASGYSTIDEPDSPIFGATYEYIAKAIERTNWLGGGSVLIAFEKRSQTVPDPIARSWAGELLKRLAAVASEKRVALAYELVWPALYETPADLIEILETAASTNVGVYFDPANVLQHMTEVGQSFEAAVKPEGWLRATLPYVKRVHMKDYSLSAGHIDLLAGDVNWQDIRQLLGEGGYDGWLVAETEVEPKDHLLGISQAGVAIDRFIEEKMSSSKPAIAHRSA